jgi:hypothetical protein
VIAVKKLHPQKGLDDTAFDNELRNLCKIRHQNIIRFLGYCHEPQRKILTHKGHKMLLEKWRDFSALNTWSMEALKSTFQVHYFLEYLASEGK